MTQLPRYRLGGDADTEASVRPSIPTASWSGAPAPNEDELIGQTLNETYVVESVIGEGGMGRVYRASHTRISSKRFAIKVLRPEFTRNTEVLARFRREAEAAACISHPNVVEVYDVDVTHDGYSYLVCEYLPGIDLADHLSQNGPLSPLRAVYLAIQICHALEAAHENGIIHRDIKPHNVFLVADERDAQSDELQVKVLDFGLSRFLDAESTQLTRTGVIMGTPSYMSPEQAEGKPSDARTDVYGVGAVIYAALAGHAPYEGDGLQAIILAVLNGAPPPLRQLNPAVPESLEFIVQTAMARAATERYPTVKDLRVALEGYHNKAQGAVTPSAAPIRLAAPSILQEPNDDEIASARPKVIGYTTLLTLLVVLGLTTCIASLELVTGPLRLTRLELGLLGSGILGTLATPALLLIGKIRQNIWRSHAKVFALLFRLRIAVFATIGAYGITTLVLLITDDVVGRLTKPWLAGSGLGLGFRGFNVVLFLVALVWAGVSAYLTARFPKRRRRTQSALAVAIGCLLAFALITAGLGFRGQMARRAAAASVPATVPIAGIVNASTATPSAQGITQGTVPVVSRRAPDEELARATVKGSAGLLPLLERYPDDPNILRPLFYDFASRATSFADAMAIAKRLLMASPEDAHDSDLRFLVRKAATAGGAASRLAFEIMTDHMGSVGADLLYDLWMSEPKVAKTANLQLMLPQVQQRYSPALAIALELRKAEGCAAKVPLLERAAGLGDKRSIAILMPLSSGTKRGCGRWKRNPCPPACAEEARDFFQTITKILERQPNGR